MTLANCHGKARVEVEDMVRSFRYKYGFDPVPLVERAEERGWLRKAVADNTNYLLNKKLKDNFKSNHAVDQ